MSMEQRLQRAFEVADRVEPSADLWSRVLYSIEEDREHRRRIVRAVVAVASVVCGVRRWRRLRRSASTRTVDGTSPGRPWS